MSLTARLLLLVTLALIPALGIGAYNEYAQRHSREAQVKAQAVTLADQSRREIRQVVEGIQRVAVTLAQIPLIRDAAAGLASPQACADLLVDLRREYPGELDVGIANRNGEVVCTTRGIGTYGRITGSHLRRAIDTGQFVVGGYGASRTEAFLSFAYPIRSAAGETVGAIVPGLSLRWLAEHMRQRFAAYDAVLAMSDRDLTYLLRLPHDEFNLVGKPAPPQGRGFVAMDGKGAFEVTGVDQVRRIAVIESLKISPDSASQPDLILAVGLSRDAAFSPINEATRKVLLLLGLGLVLALCAGVVSGRYIVGRPVERLIEAAAQWREGDYGRRVLVAGGSEFARLGAAFNSMAERIEAREGELKAGEARFRSLANLVPAFVWFGDRDGNIHFLNDRWYEYTGQTPGEALLQGWSDVLHPGDRERTLEAWTRAIESGDLFEIEAHYRRADGVYRWYLVRAQPLHDASGSITGWFGTNTDIDAIKRGEQHKALLVNELNHRVKNTLTTVQSIATQSIKADDPVRGKQAFEARLLALSAAHNVLTRENWSSAALQDIIAEAIRPYESDEEPRFVIAGPAVRVAPSMALPMAMALHELATNAAKAGALSAPSGQVAITWEVADTDGSRRLRVRWQESGGPRVEEPVRRGFGSRLIERSLAKELGGEVRMRFEPAGLVCTFDVPLRSRDPEGLADQPAVSGAPETATIAS
ncbi:MAG TPA: HWE histidine kinase domain-containing protein [Microvirga sp.]|jgi:PAS domain S-box-containing protein|nr:HWE histidine kinase domain-containing protein [Microvirga sp.]